MLLVVSFEELIRLVNMKIGGRVTDVELGQIYYLKKDNEVQFYYGDQVWHYMAVITSVEFATFYQDKWKDFEMKYRPIELLGIESNDKKLKIEVV